MHHFTIFWGVLLPISEKTLGLFFLIASLVWLAIWLLCIDPSFLAGRRWLTRPRAYWGGLLLWVIALTVFNGTLCKLVVYSGNAGALVTLDGHEVRLNPDEMAFFTVVRPIFPHDGEIDFASESQSGLRLKEKLGQRLHAAELSGHGAVRWSELVYDVGYVPRSNYVRAGSVRGDLRAISCEADDIIVSVWQKPPVVSEPRKGKIRVRYFSVSAVTSQKE